MPQLNGNQLKLLALASMTLDHMGLLLFPHILVLRVIGRLAFPIFSFMIAEGWQYTHDRKRYFLTLLVLGIAFQLVYLVVDNSLHLCIFITYVLSLCLIGAVEWAQKQTGRRAWLVPAFVVVAELFLCEGLPWVLLQYGFDVDYGFFGVLLPALVYFPRSKRAKLGWLAVGLLALSLRLGWVQIACLLSLPVLYIYNGKRGKLRLKNLFYIYYPAHLAGLWCISMLVSG